jgi:hypothetical protein
MNSVTRSLSDIPLRWMVSHIVTSDCGILFEPEALARAAIPIFSSSSESSGEHERSVEEADSSEPINDTLSGFSAWKPLEILPLTWSMQDTQGAWHTKFGCVHTSTSCVFLILSG